MNDGRSKPFRLKLNRLDIAKIVDDSRQLRITDQGFLQAASLDDVTAAYTLLSLIEFMRERRVEPDFELALNE